MSPRATRGMRVRTEREKVLKTGSARAATARVGRSSTTLMLLALGGCIEGLNHREATGPGATVLDSAGVRIVENHWPAWQETGPWGLEASHTLRSGSGKAGPEQILYQVRGVQQLNNGQIVVANAGSSQLLWYDEHGEFLRAIGRKGNGPGEFTSMYGLYRCAGDTLVVNEFRRVSFWDPHGQYVRMQRINIRPRDRLSQVLEGIGLDCSSLLIRTQTIESPPPIGSIVRPPYWLYWERHNGRRDTVAARVPWAEFFGGWLNGVHVSLVRPWGHHSAWAIDGDHVYLGLGDRPEVRMFDPKGRLVRIIRWDGEGEPITAADRRLYSERRRAYLRDKPSNFGEIYIAREKAPLPQRKPAYSRLLADDEGNLWAQKYPMGAAGRKDLSAWKSRDFPEEWTVFDRDGRWLGDVTVPANHEVLAIQRGHVVTVWRDSLDAEQIRFLRITSPNRGG